MKTTKQILKGILLWFTAFSVFCFIAGGFESLVERDKWLAAGFWLTINAALCYICYNTISYRDIYKLSGTQWFERWLRSHNQ